MIIHVRRSRSDKSTELVTYDLGDDSETWAGASVSTVLRHIQQTVDPGLAYVLSCRRGLCNLCAVRIDGETRTACTTLAVSGMTIEPARETLLLRDTIADLSLVRHARA